jgi:hypothetical protein
MRCCESGKVFNLLAVILCGRLRGQTMNGEAMKSYYNVDVI